MIKLDLSQFKGRKLDKYYPVWHFVDYSFPYKKDDVVMIKKIVVIFAFTTFGKRKIIDIFLDNSKDNRFWLEKFEQLKSRGCEKVSFMSTNLSDNVVKSMKIVYNSSIAISAAINVSIDIEKFFSDKYSSKITTKIKKLFFLEDITTFDYMVELIREEYMQNSTLLNLLLDKNLPLIKSFYQYSKSIRVMLYPYFTIRDMRNHIRKTNNQSSFFVSVDSFIEQNLEWMQKFENGTIFSKETWLVVVNNLCDLKPDLLEVFSNE